MITAVERAMSKQEFLDKFNRDTQAKKKQKKQKADKEYKEYLKDVLNRISKRKY